MAENKFAVIGLGQFGTAIAKTLAARGAEVLAIDTNDDYVEDIKDNVAYAVTMDATDQKSLRAQSIQDMNAVVVAIGENFDALLLCVVLLMEMEVKRIIARANGKHQRMILEKIGIKEILSPENDVGLAVAERLLNPTILTTLMLPDNYEIAEVQTPRTMVNRNIGDIGLRTKYNLNLITIKRYTEKPGPEVLLPEPHILGVPSPDLVLLETDTILVFGLAIDVERFIEINK